MSSYYGSYFGDYMGDYAGWVINASPFADSYGAAQVVVAQADSIAGYDARFTALLVGTAVEDD